MKSFQDFIDESVEELNETPHVKEDVSNLEASDHQALRKAYYKLADGIQSLQGLRFDGEFKALNAEIDRMRRDLSKVSMVLGKYL